MKNEENLCIQEKVTSDNEYLNYCDVTKTVNNKTTFVQLNKGIATHL